MNRDAHYYAILAFCRACGFNKDSALTIAYASQFVDDAKINLMFINNLPSLQLLHDRVNHRPAFFNMATCHSYFQMRTFNYEAMVNNTTAFHFVPGCKGENFTKMLRCTEESPVILDIIKDVFLEDDLIKLGIVLHVYADTFSHQGFSGVLSKVNDIKNCIAKTKVESGILEELLAFWERLSPTRYEKSLDHLLPAYGHCQALELPDLPYVEWSYEYDYSDEFNGSYKLIEIKNKERYQRAFLNLKKYLEAYLIKHKQYFDRNVRFENYDLLLETLIKEGTNKVREKHWQNTLIEQGLFNKQERDLIVYDEDKWLRKAFLNFDHKDFNQREVDGVQLAKSFPESHWYGFYLAVKWYKKKFFEYCTKHQITIPN
ncbi:DUF6765 family protein [Desulfosporosinus sp. SB140]|uniref:DUF6765 family protein n=1 Tax=Desulfosporosinus paludis TaxID=3115649 RepID=UPI00388F6697